MNSKESFTNPEHTQDRVQRLMRALSKFGKTGEGDTIIRTLVEEIKESEAEIIHDLAKDNAVIKSMFGAPALALALNDDSDDDD